VEDDAMKLPGLTEAEIDEWLAGPNIARVGTINEDGTPRVTAFWYRREGDGSLTLNTYEDNVHVRNLKRDGRVALLIDSSDQPYKSVHVNGDAEVADEAATAEEIGRLYERYFGGREAAIEYGNQLVSAGKRVNIRVRPQRQHTVDFGKMGGSA
jgi:PPOX class probable F420-dependent enzyme